MDPINQQPIQPTMPPVQPAPMTPPPVMMMPDAPKEHRPWGPIIGIVVILALLIAAAVYIWGQKLNNDAKEPPAPVTQQVNVTNQPAAVAEPTDDFTSIENDLDASVEGLDDSNF